MGMGDYPDLGRCSGIKRPRMLWYDDEDMKRNFGTPMQWDFHTTTEVGWDSESHLNVDTPEFTFVVFCTIVTGFVALLPCCITWAAVIFSFLRSTRQTLGRRRTRTRSGTLSKSQSDPLFSDISYYSFF